MVSKPLHLSKLYAKENYICELNCATAISPPLMMMMIMITMMIYYKNAKIVRKINYICGYAICSMQKKLFTYV